MDQFLLAIDVGNSSTAFGIFNSKTTIKNPSPKVICEVPTSSLKGKKVSKKIRNLLLKQGLNPRSVKAIYISNVVPAVHQYLHQMMISMCHQSPHFITHKSPSPVSIHYRNPKEVGADRIVNARGALAYHKGPLVVVDFGTATTFDCVSKKGEYLGGVIAAGPVMSAEALYLKTAKLPYVHLKKPSLVIGKDTKESIQSGLYYGYRGLVKEIVDELKQSLGKSTYVIATGGQAKWMLKGVRIIDQFIAELTMIGLYHLWRDAE